MAKVNTECSIITNYWERRKFSRERFNNMPGPTYGLSRGFFQYTSDNTDNYVIATTQANAAAANPVGSPANPRSAAAYPRGFSPRRVYGSFDSSGVIYRTHYIAFVNTDLGYVGTNTTFTKSGTVFTIQGVRGEKQYYRGG